MSLVGLILIGLGLNLGATIIDVPSAIITLGGAFALLLLNIAPISARCSRAYSPALQPPKNGAPVLAVGSCAASTL